MQCLTGKVDNNNNNTKLAIYVDFGLYSCNMGTNGLPDPCKARNIIKAAGPRADGVHIGQTTSAHVTTVMHHGPSYCQALRIIKNN